MSLCCSRHRARQVRQLLQVIGVAADMNGNTSIVDASTATDDVVAQTLAPRVVKICRASHGAGKSLKST